MGIIATAGHVDHGKSSLVQALTGTDPDRLAEEKRRGMTIDLGFAHSGSLSFIDVPGHTDFLNTMVAGVHGVHSALLVIDAGEGWKPQTFEHLDIVSLMHVQHIVVAITKVDASTPEHTQQLMTATREIFSSRGIKPHDIVCTSAHTGEGIEQLRAVLTTLTSQPQPHNSAHNEPRLFIDRVFTIAGAGTVVTGTLGGAPIHVGDELVLSHTGAPTKVRSIQQHGESATTAHPGNRCALNLTQLTVDDIHRGDVLIRNNAWHNTEVFDAAVVLAHGETEIKNGGGYTMHIGASRRAASIRYLGGDRTHLRVHFTGALPLIPTDRFLLRRTGNDTTVGAGTIVDVKPVARTTRAHPTGTTDSILEHHGWVTVHHAQMLVGAPVQPVAGEWVASTNTAANTTASLRKKLDDGDVDTTQLEPWERAVIATLNGVTIQHGIATLATTDPLLAHPYVQMFRDAGVITPDTKTLDRDVMRRLIHAGVLSEHDNIAFHTDTLHGLRPQLEQLWQQHPTGFTVSHLREALNITRKHAVPLATCLDKAGLTKRAGDARIPGPAW
jgi:selenocysteine-specific elongation factor